MTTPIPGAAATGGAATAATSTAARNSLDSDTFLKLLVAQLRYQDPSNPADATSFLSQTAQFTQVEKLDALLTAQQEQVTTGQIATATNLVGKQVSYLADDGTPATGTVTAASLTGGTASLHIGTSTVPLSAITGIRLAGG